MNKTDNILIERDILRIGNNAVKEAQIKSLQKGIPTVYSLNGTIFYQLPDGAITMKQPNEYSEIDRQLSK
jgi:phosphopantetheinyl transferase (holo-ACP synthase)